ncbi:MAG TPA: hypothetical protein VI112_10015 [Bacteroidia bacterium]|jgi:hypothetical protein
MTLHEGVRGPVQLVWKEGAAAATAGIAVKNREAGSLKKNKTEN